MSEASSSRTMDKEGSTESSVSSPSEPRLVDTLLSQVDGASIDCIIETQSESLRRFEKSNEMLSNCNLLAAKRLERARKDLGAHRDLIVQMKNDLEFIFKKIRFFKGTLAAKYPHVYNIVEAEFKEKRKANGLDDDDEEAEMPEKAEKERNDDKLADS